ncbi:MAG: MFS transporter [Actinomycetota bacterium]
MAELHHDDRGTEVATVRNRTRWVLIGSVFPAGMGMTASFAATSLVAEDITGSDTLATLAATMHAIGGALAAVPLGRYMATHGRRPGLLRSWVIGSIGATIAFLAVLAEFYPLLVVGILGIGVGQAGSLAARYAAADLSEDDSRARDIGIVVWASSIGSVLGPTVALGGTGWLAANLLGIEELAGPYLMGIGVFALAAMVVNTYMRPDPLLLAQELGGATDAPERPSLVESFRKLVTHRLAAIAVFAMAIGQGVMVAVMTVTPLHMDEGDHEVEIIGLVISLHIVGMYFFSPVVGWLVDRLPTVLMIGAAGIILFTGAELASHTDPEDSLGVFVGLFLVGVGWSFAMIAGSALLTSAFPVEERASVQGAADFTMVTSGATGGLLSGAIVEASSFHALSHWAGVLALALVAAALYPTVTNIKPKTPSNV